MTYFAGECMLACQITGVSIHSRKPNHPPPGLLTWVVRGMHSKSLAEKMLHERYYNFFPADLPFSR
jgi:hypothetical protein